jgi:hypothetical protein
MFAAKDIFQTASTGGYKISRSVRLRSSATASLTRTPSSATNRQTWTWSGWLKGGLFSDETVFEAATDANNTTICYFDSTSRLVFINVVSASTNLNFTTSQVFRDP